jgi:inositol-phosphate phosphatase/L-galactose 1-phosphate phosphatase/histidinol-phosphatase
MTADPFVAFAESLADAARPVAMRWFRTGIAVEDKADASPVTLADRAVERQLRQMIGERYPEHGILGEEHGGEGIDRELVWVLDPIDGTRAFIAGVPMFGSLIALVRNGRPVVGVIEMPALGERFTGHAGHPTLADGRVCHTRDCGGLDHAILSATSPEMFSGASAEAFGRLAKVVKHRRYGLDCYAFALIALGCIDLVMERDLQPYDYMALVPVIEGAGGVITDWQGQPLGLDSTGEVLAAATPALHRAALAVIGPLS